MPATLPQSIKGKRSHHHHPCVTCCVEKMLMVSFPLLLFFFISNFSQHLFTVKLLFIGHAGHPPSVYQGNKSTPPPSPCCLLHGEGSDGEFSSCFCFPPLFKFFSHSLFFQFNCCLFAVFPILPPPLSHF